VLAERGILLLTGITGIVTGSVVSPAVDIFSGGFLSWGSGFAVPAVAGQDASSPMLAIFKEPFFLYGIGILILLIMSYVLLGRRETDMEKRQAADMGGESEDSADLLRRVQDLATSIDDRARDLQQLIEMAEERVRYLQNLQSDQDVRNAGRGKSIIPTAENPLQEGVLETDPLVMAVQSLAEEGCSSEEIAIQLDEDEGRVELILSAGSAEDLDVVEGVD